MTSWDYFVGFEREPENLDNFLVEQGYAIVQPYKPDLRAYESLEGLIDLFYYPDIERKAGVSDWKRGGFRVTSELMILTKDFDSFEKARELMEETVRRYDAISYDPYDLDSFFRRDQL